MTHSVWKDFIRRVCPVLFGTAYYDPPTVSEEVGAKIVRLITPHLARFYDSLGVVDDPPDTEYPANCGGVPHRLCRVDCRMSSCACGDHVFLNFIGAFRSFQYKAGSLEKPRPDYSWDRPVIRLSFKCMFLGLAACLDYFETSELSGFLDPNVDSILRQAVNDVCLQLKTTIERELGLTQNPPGERILT